MEEGNVIFQWERLAAGLEVMLLAWQQPVQNSDWSDNFMIQLFYEEKKRVGFKITLSSSRAVDWIGPKITQF